MNWKFFGQWVHKKLYNDKLHPVAVTPNKADWAKMCDSCKQVLTDVEKRENEFILSVFFWIFLLGFAGVVVLGVLRSIW